jgi:hypothetical protein
VAGLNSDPRLTRYTSSQIVTWSRFFAMNVLITNGRSFYLLPFGVQQLVHHGLMSSEVSSPLSFPAHANPTPLEIFHLKKGCSQEEIKRRCKQLIVALTNI